MVRSSDVAVLVEICGYLGYLSMLLAVSGVSVPAITSALISAYN
jgi:hypothetical protein